MDNDLNFRTPGGTFNYRVGAIIIRGSKLLMVKSGKPRPYYWTVGGRVKLHETAEQAIQREVLEETGIAFEAERLAFIHENFFEEKELGERYHEMNLYFLMKPNSAADSIADKAIVGDQPGDILEWLPFDKLSDIQIYPEFFRTKLKNPGGGIEHIVTVE